MLVVLVLVDVIVTVQIREKRGSDEEDRLCVHDATTCVVKCKIDELFGVLVSCANACKLSEIIY